jgi:uncharacterized protein with beta-barrel porin domain
MQSAGNYDFVTFDSSLSGTISLQSSLPQVNAAMTITGPQSGQVVIDGQSLHQIFNIGSSGASISNLRLLNGFSVSSGGAVYVSPSQSVQLSHLYISPCPGGTGCNMPVFVDNSATITAGDVSFAQLESSLTTDILLNDSTYILDSDLSSMLPLRMDGTGNLIKQGSGTVELSTLSSPADISLNVNEGTLIFTGNLSEPAIVGSAGILMGNSSVLYLVNNGVVGPGSGIGVISMSGDYNQSGALQIEISPAGGTSDLLQVSGNATLGGSLELLPQTTSAYFKGTKYTVLTTGGAVTGRFSSTASALPGVRYEINYLDQSVEIEILNNVISWSGEPFLGNGAVVKRVIENADVVPGSDLTSVIEALNALDPPSSLDTALNELHPGLFGALAWADAALMHQVDALFTNQRLSFCQMRCGKEGPCCSRLEPNGVWVSGLGEINWQEAIGQLRGFRSTTGGAALGLEGSPSERSKVGLGGAYTHSNLTWDDGAGSTTINGGYGSLYSAFCLGPVVVDGSLLGSYYSYDIRRNIISLNRSATSAPQGYGLLAHAGASTFFPTESYGTYAPFAAAEYISVWRAKIDEMGADSMTLAVRSGREGFVRAEAGVSVSHDGCFSWGKVIPRVSLSWVYLTPVSGTTISSRFAGIPEEFTVETTDHGVNEAAIAGSLGMAIGEGFWIEAAYAGEFSPQRIEQDVNLNLRWQF